MKLLPRLFLLILSLITVFSLLAGSGTTNFPDKSDVTTTNTWSFVALGDSRQQASEWDYDNDKYFHDNSSNPTRAAIITSVVQNNPDMEFILHTGDIVSSGGEQDDWNRYFEDITNATKENVTFYYAIGNHEAYTYAIDSSTWGPRDENFSTYLANVELPGNERYYSFDYMNQIHFVIINTEEDWNGAFDITTDQYDWLINDLENNDIEFIVAAYHRPSHSIRDINRVDDAQQVNAVLEPIFLQYGVDLVFSGHDHYYYRTKRSGITYLTTGGAGADLYANGDVSEWQDGDVYFSNFHYCNISVNEDAGDVTVNIDVLIFNESDRTTIVGDSFQVSNTILDITSTTETTETPTTTTSSETLDETSFTSNETTPEISPFISISTMLGVIFLFALRKRR